ncbi:Lysozyme-like [Virgibacillus subterraneus]|uniref:Lysozyme-like n=1 Tax=Virgibacillus subterraneus TaxID=621109 RepID=A0A1H8ZZ81_9BACI|nr:lysozyme family protein [Virgibacillus subterraneus]SEP69571.1 Lysozyme-like [Virgibacillus subterraneus]
MKRKTKTAIKQTVVIAVVLTGVFIIVSFLALERPDSHQFEVSRPLISEQVWEYKPTVEKYAKQYGVTKYVDVMLAMMMQESGGRGNDPMQSSESYCGERGCIDEPELSIKQGVYYFSQTIKQANGDLKLAIQSYNFGKGFIDYINDNSGTYTQEAAINFSQKMYNTSSNKSIYTCLREEAKQYNACYGDIYYVRDVMEYRDELAKE